MSFAPLKVILIFFSEGTMPHCGLLLQKASYIKNVYILKVINAFPKTGNLPEQLHACVSLNCSKLSSNSPTN